MPGSSATMTAGCRWLSATLAADPLSRGRYDGDAIERLAATAHTGLGRIEIGITDGAGAAWR